LRKRERWRGLNGHVPRKHRQPSLCQGCARRISTRLGFSYRLSVGPLTLHLFRAKYAELKGTSIQLFDFGVLGLTVRYHCIAVARLQYRMLQATRVLFAGGLVELAFAHSFGRIYGLLGLTAGWLIAVTIEAIVMYPPIDRVRRGGMVGT
jgi:hypothetical protein